MKKVLLGSLAFLAAVSLAAPSQAADLPVKAPIVAPYNWTGFYVGGNVGYSWGRSATDAAFFNNTTGVLLFTNSNTFNMDGWLGGLQLGYNWQNGKWVAGLEGDIQATGQKGGTTFGCPGAICNLGLTAIAAAVAPVNVTTFNQRLDWFGTFRGRLGVTVTPTVLAYVTGGLAWGHIKTDGTITGFTGGGVATSAGFSGSSTKLGWTIGAGVEGQISGRWTTKLEYIYMDLGTVNTTGLLPTNFIPIRAEFSSKITDNILRVGLNYRF